MTRLIGRTSDQLDEVIRAHRFTIAFVFPTVGAILLIASAEGIVPDVLAFHPVLLLLGIVVIRSPILAGILPVLNRRVLAILGVLVGYTYAIEYIGVQTGIPYGDFEYGIGIGPMIGEIPLLLPLLFVPLAINAYLIVRLTVTTDRIGPIASIPVLGSAVAMLIAIDFVLDPGAVALGFWVFDGNGTYYGVPWTNYAGWVLSATVAIVFVHLAFARSSLIDRGRRCEFILDDLVSFTILWGMVNGYYGNTIPVVVALVIISWLWRIGRLDAITIPNSSTRNLVQSGRWSRK